MARSTKEQKVIREGIIRISIKTRFLKFDSSLKDSLKLEDF